MARTLLEQFPVGYDHAARQPALARETDAEIGADACRLARRDRNQRGVEF